jgi:hypothetical protein
MIYPNDETTNYCRGERHPRARLSDDDARQILTRWLEGGGVHGLQMVLAKEWHVPPLVIHTVVRRKAWRAATGAVWDAWQERR